MKKIIFTIVLSFTLLAIQAQEKGLYLTLGGGLGANTFCYTLDNDNHSVPKLGFGGNLGVQYFFTKHWGLATGVGITFYNTKGSYSNNWQNDPAHYSFENMSDDDILHPDLQNYTLRLSLDNWTETQKAYFLEIPLMLMYQTKWGLSQSWGMYAGLGVKVQLPVLSKEYSVSDKSELATAGYIDGQIFPYPDPNGPDLSRHGFGTTDETGYSGDLDLKTGFAVAGEIGLLKTLSRRVDLSLGIYLDYGLNDIKDGNKTEGAYLISPENGSNTIHPSEYVGDNLQYNGYINSHAVDKTTLLAMGGKVGIRVKLGKLPKKEDKKDTIAAPQEYIYSIWVRDSLTKKPLLTESKMVCSNCPQADIKEFYSSIYNPFITELHPANTYPASFTKPRFRTYQTTITTTAEEREIDILVPLHPDLLGDIKTTNNVPLQGVNIEVTTSAGKSYQLVSNEVGHFEIPSVDAGTVYKVIATKAGYLPDTAYLEIPSDPYILEPTYTVEALVGGMRLKPMRKMVLSALVLFDLDKHNLRSEAKEEINKIIPMLKENPEITVAVGGHTDSRGSAKHNQTLSQNRANSVRAYLIEQGIDAKRVKAKGYGFSQLVNMCKPRVKCSEQDHQDNRRVEFLFSEKTVIVK